MMNEDKTHELLNRILQALGGHCEQGIPTPESDMSGVGARTFVKSTLYDGTVGIVGPTNLALAVNISTAGFALNFSQCFDATGNRVHGEVRVYFDKPSAGNANNYVILRSGEWLKRRRGFQDVWVVNDDPNTEIAPVLKVSTDPSFEILGCCDDPLAAEMSMPNFSQHAQDTQSVPTTQTEVPGGFSFTVLDAGKWHWEFSAHLSKTTNDWFKTTCQIVVNGVVKTQAIVRPPVSSQSCHLTAACNWTGVLAVGDVVKIMWLAPSDGSGVGPDGIERDAFGFLVEV